MSSSRQWAALVGAASRPAPGRDRFATIATAVARGHEVAPAVVGCSVTELTGDGYRTIASSVELARLLDEAQYAVDEGPCVSAARTGRLHHLVDLPGEFAFGS